MNIGMVSPEKRHCEERSDAAILTAELRMATEGCGR